jgi:PBP1b-binding outer membrane lipoprotein LpoB
MKRTQNLIFLLIGILFLAACTENAALQSTVETAVTEPATVSPTSLTLIGETGRPQLLNAYASW